MESAHIRRRFLDYFKKNQHTIIPSSPVVPHDDPTLLFTNAGMNQFKDVFLGSSKRDYKRATTSQKCIRVGGKHNDLENVGHTRRHLTFFEMLGNFSFGDYFKKDAIRFAWEISTQVFQFDDKRIWPTVFREDDEAFELWKQFVPTERIIRLNEDTNFWAMGETGPCGPCSELLFDRGPSYGSATNPKEDLDGERYLEFWNLVFMQFNPQADGEMHALPKPSIDTGAGLERVMSLLEDVDSVFETDILRGLIAQTETVTGKRYDAAHPQTAAAFRVIADHLRCLAFAIADGVQPSNVDRGYVLRKVLRRAVRYGRSLGADEPFLGRVLPRLVSLMGDDYPEIKKGENRISEILAVEEEAFLRTLRRGGNILNQIIERSESHGNVISGDDAFKLKDTYGLPLEEIGLIAKDAGLTVDTLRYQELETAAKERSRSAHKTTRQIAGQNIFEDFVEEKGPTTFLGYDKSTADARVVALVKEGSFVENLAEGDEGMVILDKTPFYAEMGGQVGDTGLIKTADSLFDVMTTEAPFKGVIAHVGKIQKGSLKVGETVTAAIQIERRKKVQNNHTATHLLHWALHHVLGEHIKQAGSVVDADRLRFDFSHHKALTVDEIRKIEHLINTKIRENHSVKWYEIAYEEAQKREDIKQFFGEKYGSSVRVIDIDFSKELCGGTHTTSLGNIGYFRVAKESSIAAGVRRIEAVTGADAETFAYEIENAYDALATLLKTPSTKVQERIEKLLDENKKLSSDLKSYKQKENQTKIKEFLNRVETIQQVPVLMIEMSSSADEMKDFMEQASTHFHSGVLVLAGTHEGRCNIVIRVSDDFVKKGIQAQTLVKEIAPLIEGSGGGRPQQAQAGGKAPEKVGEALSKVREWIHKNVSAG